MKKTDNRNLYPGRIFLGLTIALAAVLAAFEWRTAYILSADLPGEDNDENIFYEQAPIYIIEEVKEEITKAKKTTPDVMNPSEEITIVDDIVKIEKELKFADPIVLPIKVAEEKAPEEKRDPFIPVEQMPEFPGGESDLYKFLQNNINYPRFSKEAGITGVVYVEFIVDVDGSLTNIKIAKGVSSDIDQEALRIVKKMPKWIPGSQRTKVVPVGMRLPIRFRII